MAINFLALASYSLDIRRKRRPPMTDELRDELKEKIEGVIADARNEDYDGCLTMDLDEAVDSILSLIDAERCVWTEKTRSNGVIVYKTSCGKQAITWERKNFNETPFCQVCGKQIEVKRGERWTGMN
jgi:hypothetical protein